MLAWSFVSFALLASPALARPVYYLHSRRAALDTGSCGSPEIEFANGLDGRKEPAFAPVNTKDFNHGSALNIGVISSFICQQLNDKCKASQATLTACTQAQAAAAKQTGGAAADAFNAALGIQSNFAASDAAPAASSGAAATNGAASGKTQCTASSAASATAGAASSNNKGNNNNDAAGGKKKGGKKGGKKNGNNNAGAAKGQNNNNAGAAANNNNNAGAASSSGAAAAASNVPSIGNCKNPTIAFGIFDNRTEDSFEPANLADFNHGSALNINIITQFICDTFVNKCNANQAAINSCAAAKLAVNGKTGQAAADAFNAAVLKPVN